MRNQSLLISFHMGASTLSNNGSIWVLRNVLAEVRDRARGK